MSVNPLVLAEAGKIVNELIITYGKYKVAQETERTERIRIRASLLALTKKIEAQTEIFKSYLEKRFEERHKLYNIAEQIIQSGIQERDYELIKYGTSLIQSIYSEDPLNGNTLLQIKDIN